MKEVITHLPLSPYPNPELGYWGIHCQAKTFSNLTQKPYVLGINVLGEKPTKGNPEDTEGFLKELNIFPELVWKDTQEKFLEFAKAIIQKAIDSGLVYIQEREVFLCPCGKTEFLNVEENLNPNIPKSTYEVTREGVRCNVCGVMASLIRRPCLLMKIPNEINLGSFKIYPPYAKKEINTQINFWRGKEYLLSRCSARPISVETTEGSFAIDVDGCWIPFIHYLAEEHKLSVAVLLTGERVLKQTALVLLINQLLGAPLPSLIVATPYINIDFGGKPNLKSREILAANGPQVVRIFLGQSIGYQGKELQLSSRQLYLIRMGLNNLKDLQEIPFWKAGMASIEEFLKRGKVEEVNRISKKLRAGEPLIFEEQLFLWLLLK